MLNSSCVYYFATDCPSAHRMKNIQNKIPANPKSSKPLSAPHHSYQNENKNPGNSEMGRKAPVRPGVSRLPVLAKSLRLQTPSDFSQSHCKWEEKPLVVSAAFPSWFKCLFFEIHQMILIFLTLCHFPYRGKLRRKSHAPGQYLSTCRIPRAQEWPLKMSSPYLFHNQGLALTLSNMIKMHAMLV